MQNQIPCVVIKDLLPSYVDGLTSEETNELIRAHIAECDDCRATLAAMQEPTPAAEIDKKEIDFLKKNRKKNIKVLIGSLIACIVLAAGIIGLRTFVIGSPSTRGMLVCDTEVKLGRTLILEGTVVDSYHGISKIDIKEEADGVIKVNTRAVVASRLYSGGDIHVEFNAENRIHQVWLDGSIIWENGAQIPQRTFDIFQTRHEYIGDAPANSALARMLEVEAIVGPYENELETAAEPYEWKIILLEDQPVAERDVEALAYVMLGLVENLGKVTFQGPSFTKTVTAEEATAFFEQDIKNCGQSVSTLNTLIQKTRLFNGLPFTFQPDSVEINEREGFLHKSYISRKPDEVADLYSRYQNMQLTGDLINAYENELNDRQLEVTFRDSTTGRTWGFYIIGPYKLIFENDDYYFKKIVEGETLYDILCDLIDQN